MDIKQNINDGLLKSEAHVKKLRIMNSRFIYLSLIASVLATLIAGLTAILGPLAGQGPPAWKATCGLIAVFTAVATVFTGLHKQLTVSERLAKATLCAGKLKSIELTLSINENNTDEALKEYKEVIANYGEFIV